MLKLIIVDDEPLALKYIFKIIDWEQHGFKLCALIDNGEKAINYIKENKPDLVITDIKMPKVTGLDIAKFCYENAPDTSVVLLTGFREFEYAQQAVKYGVSDYLIKPIMPDDIAKALDKLQKHIKPKASYEKFNSDEQVTKLQILFSNLMCGIIQSKAELEKSFKAAGIISEYVEHPCVVINLHICDYDNYMTNVWTHGFSGLYRAISSIIKNVDSNYTFSLIRYSHANVEIIGCCSSKNDEQFKNADAAIVKLSENLSSMIKLEHEITNKQYFQQTSELINTKSQSKVEEFAHKNAVINKAYEFIKDNYSKSISTRDAAAYVHLSNVYFGIFYKQHTGENFTDTLNKYRLEKAKEYLENETELKTSMIYTKFGFSNQGHFYKIFKQYTGMTPLKYRQKIYGDK